MLKPVLVLLLLSLQILAPRASEAADLDDAALPDRCVAGEKTALKFAAAREAPASSFFRVAFECPQMPKNGKVEVEPGYPESSIIFTAPGVYECGAELGLVTKTSCAGAHYRELGKREFKITVAPAGGFAQ